MVKKGRSRARRGKRLGGDANWGETTWQLKQGKVHTFVRSNNNGELPKTPGDQGYATIFSLNQLPSSSDFTNLFDQYKITRVDMTFEMDIADGSLNSTTRYPRIVVAPDFNNQSAPLTENELLQYEQCKKFQFSAVNRRMTVSLQPKIAATVFRTGVTSAYQMMSSGWMDVAVPDVPHYGVRYFVTNHNTSNFGGNNIRVFVKYYLSFKNAA